MSRKDGRPSRAFSLLYFATHELEASLRSATAVATSGSVLSMLMVVLTLLITSAVSFTYSSSLAATAWGATGRSSAWERTPAVTAMSSLRRGCGVGGGAALVVVVGSLDLIRKRGLGLVVGVMSVGEAMDFGDMRPEEESLYFSFLVRKKEGWLIATWAYHLILFEVFFMGKTQWDEMLARYMRVQVSLTSPHHGNLLGLFLIWNWKIDGGGIFLLKIYQIWENLN